MSLQTSSGGCVGDGDGTGVVAVGDGDGGVVGVDSVAVGVTGVDEG